MKEHIEYHTNGKLYKQMYYKDGLLEGDYKVFDINGRLLTKSTYVNGKLNGKQKTYYPILTEIDFVDDIAIGFIRSYYPNGKLSSELEIFDWVPVGREKIWDEKGRVKEI